MSFPRKLTAGNWFPSYSILKRNAIPSGDYEESGWVVTYWSFLFPAVERYNPQENRWHTIAPMGTRRKHLGCAVYQDMIYAVGGRDDTTELSSAERYNPRTNQWSPVVAMTSRRSGVSASCRVLCKQARRVSRWGALWATLGHWEGKCWSPRALFSAVSAVKLLLDKVRGNPKPKQLMFLLVASNSSS